MLYKRTTKKIDLSISRWVYKRYGYYCNSLFRRDLKIKKVELDKYFKQPCFKG